MINEIEKLEFVKRTFEGSLSTNSWGVDLTDERNPYYIDYKLICEVIKALKERENIFVYELDKEDIDDMLNRESSDEEYKHIITRMNRGKTDGLYEDIQGIVEVLSEEFNNPLNQFKK